MEAQQFFIQLLSDYALLSVFTQSLTPRDLHRLTVCSRDLREAVKRGAMSAFYDLKFNGECSRAVLQVKQARAWLDRDSVHPPQAICDEKTERCSLCPNYICTVRVAFQSLTARCFRPTYCGFILREKR
jgi:hypothetical protein